MFLFPFFAVTIPAIIIWIAIPLAFLCIMFIYAVKLFRYIYEKRHPEVKEDFSWKYSILNDLP